MAFSSLFFVLVFLPVYLICCRCLRTIRAQNNALLILSVVFYAFSGLGSLVLIFLMTLTGYLAGIRIEKVRFQKDRMSGERGKGGKKDLVISCIVFLAVLGVFKYAGFVSESLNHIPFVSLPVPELILPLGLSFYLFKLISYVADVYQGRCGAEHQFDRLFSYTICFHHISQGPIVRYKDVAPFMDDRVISNVGMARGIYRFCIGLGKKVILADYCGKMADILMPATDEITSMPVLSLWLGSIFFTLQMYLDFSAYCDMALGLGRMAGFRYEENFNYPYIAGSVRDFWRRWHITLSRFFRDYVYIPLGGNRVGTGRLMWNLLVVWLLTGLWHGSSWNYILWGLYYYVFVALEQLARKKGLRPLPVWLGHVYTILVFNFGWVLFRFSDFNLLGGAIAGMFGANGTGLSDSSLKLTFQNNIFFLTYAVLACTPFFKWLDHQLAGKIRRQKWSMNVLYTVRSAAAILIFVWSVLGMAGNTYTPFLYNQF